MEGINYELISNVVCKFFKRKIEYYHSHEYNVASIAYNFASNSYKEGFGDFNNYAIAVINSFLIEYCYKNSITLEFSNDNDLFVVVPNLKEEIDLLTNKLGEYKISFSKLMNSSPKSLTDRNIFLNVASLCLKESFIVSYLERTKKLPLKRISIFSDIDINMLKKYNDYIIFLIIILAKDTFLSFKSYLNIKAGDDFGD